MDLRRLLQELLATGLPGRLFELARDEDLGERGDVSSAVSIAPEAVLVARLAARDSGVLAGLGFVQALANAVAPGVSVEPILSDGDAVERGTTVALLRGPARSVLAAERPVLNLVGRLSGIATLTAEAVRRVAGTKAAVCDTRKTTPGLRVLEKYAVVCGGGTSHRMGLHDAVMLKDNHLASMLKAEGEERLEATIERAAREARRRHPDQLRFVQVECDSIEQFEAVLRVPAGLVDLVLLDNMPPEELARAVTIRGDRAIGLEASGGITLQTIAQAAATGVDRISLGQLTTQAVGLDFGLDHICSVPRREPEPPLSEWADAIEAVLQTDTKVVVVAETASTQDVARSMAESARPVVVIAGRQTAGRGRLGRAWHDAEGASVAASIALPDRDLGSDWSPSSDAGLVAMAGGIALCQTAHALLPEISGSPWDAVALRWPNDAVHTGSGKKLGGVLVERGDATTVVGIGLNVGQVATLSPWPPQLEGSAASLAELGASCHRLDALTTLLHAFQRCLTLPREELLSLVHEANGLRRQRCIFEHDRKRHEGVVCSIDPEGAIELETDDGRTLRLPANSTSLLHDER